MPFKILVAPLNWGLGHASRSVPIVEALLKKGCEVVLASDGAALALFRTEFPSLDWCELPGWDVRYFSENMVWNIARQFPAMTRAVRAERVLTEKLVGELGLDGIISDNRYGCFSEKVPSAIVTHQLDLPVGSVPLRLFANHLLRKKLSSFGSVWVPDFAGEPNLSGPLSHKKGHGLPVSFIGPLSRFQKEKGAANPQSAIRNPQSKVLVVLSGPEPQRTFFEEKLMEQARALPERFLFVQGLMGEKRRFWAVENIEFATFLTADELFEEFETAELAVCRSGYSSLMDVIFLRKKALLVPTPGQGEQELLAAHFSKMPGFAVQSQRGLDLGAAIAFLRKSPEPGGQAGENDLLGETLDRWLAAL